MARKTEGESPSVLLSYNRYDGSATVDGDEGEGWKILRAAKLEMGPLEHINGGGC